MKHLILLILVQVTFLCFSGCSIAPDSCVSGGDSVENRSHFRSEEVFKCREVERYFDIDVDTFYSYVKGIKLQLSEESLSHKDVLPERIEADKMISCDYESSGNSSDCKDDMSFDFSATDTKIETISWNHIQEKAPYANSFSVSLKNGYFLNVGVTPENNIVLAYFLDGNDNQVEVKYVLEK